MKGCTCSHTRVSIRVAERPSLSAGALVSCVARLTELGAALPRLHGAQRFVCMSETEKEAWSSHTAITWKKKKNQDRRRWRLPRTYFTVDAREARLADAVVASHAVGTHAAVLAGLVCTLVSIWTRRRRGGERVFQRGRAVSISNQALTNIDGPEEILQDKTCKVIPLCEDAVLMQTVRPRSSWPFGTSPGRNAWPARTCTRSPCRLAPWWSRRRCASGGAWASSPAVCPRTLHVMRVSDVSSTIRWNTDNQTGFKLFTEIRKFKKFEPEGLIISCCW